MISEDINQKITINEADSTSDGQIEFDVVLWPKLYRAPIDNISILAKIIKVTTQNSEVDPAAILLTFISGFGAAVGSEPHIKIGDTTHPPRINAILVGSSSRARKGTSEKPVRRILEMAEKFADAPKLKVTPGPLSSGEGVLSAIRDSYTDGNRIHPGVTDKRLWCIESEFASVFKSCKRDGNTLSCIIRTAWDGGTIEPLTKNDKICVTDPHICILGHITQEELNQALNTTETWNGFANRFLWACVQRKRLVALPTPMNEEEANAIGWELGELLKLARTRLRVHFTESATKFWEAIYSTISTDHPGRFGAITARAEAQTLRIALMCALLDGKEEIDLQHLQAAIAIWQYCSDSADFLFRNSHVDPNVEKIIQALRAGPKTTTEIHRLFSQHKNGAELKEILKKLQMSGKIISQARSERGVGKQATIWEIVTR